MNRLFHFSHSVILPNAADITKRTHTFADVFHTCALTIVHYGVTTIQMKLNQLSVG